MTGMTLFLESTTMDQQDLIKRLEETIKLLRSETYQLKSVIDNLPGSIYWKDKEGVYLGRNMYAMQKMQNANFEKNTLKETIIGKTDYDFFSRQEADRYRQHDLEVMKSKKELALEEPVRLPNGEIMIQLSTKRPLYDEKGEVIGIVGNTIDVTRLKQIEAELRDAKEQAEQANLIKTEFMRNMEHDIRTPFSGIWGMAGYLAETEEDELKKEYLNDITQSAKELLDYCNSILDFSRIESGALAIIEKKFNLNKIIDSVIVTEKPAAIMKKLDLRKKTDKNSPLVIIGDHYRLHRILINLLSNSIKFTHSGHVELNVQVVEKKDRRVVIRFIIEDTGIGIPKDKQDYIFEKFSRLSLSNKGSYKGIGLGLRIVKQFMHEMGGEIDVISPQGQGAQFICTIPFRLPLTDDFF